MLRTTRSLWAALSLLIAGVAGAAPALRYQVEQQGDFRLIGNTMGWDCSVGTGAVVRGTVIDFPGSLIPLQAPNRCFDNSSSGPDVYWVSNSLPDGGGATANRNANTPAAARTVSMLALPAGATVTYARLYWGGLASGTSADGQVTLSRPGGFSQALNADVQSTAAQFGTPGNVFYQSSVEVTALVAAQGAGAFRVSGVDTRDFRDTGESDTTRQVFTGGWSLVVYYRDSTDLLRNLALFDGLEQVDPTHPADTQVQGFRVPNSGFDAKLGLVAYEGDQSITGDFVKFDGITDLPDGGRVIGDGGPISNGNNPANNFFNSTRSSMGVGVHTAGDLPELTGEPGSMSGIDIDIVDVSSRLSLNQTAARISAGSTQDVYLLGVLATSIAVYDPDFTTSTKAVTNLTNGAAQNRPGDLLEYVITLRNTGNDASRRTVLTDPLPAGLTYASGTLTLEGSSQTDEVDGDRAEYDATTRTVTARVGTGATSSQGGRLDPGSTFTVRFRATIDANYSGSLQNQAFIRFEGDRGSPVNTAATSSSSGTGQPTEVVVTSTPRPTITAPADGAQLTTARPVVSGTGENGNAITVKSDGVTVCTTTVAGGTWSCTPTADLLDGPHVLTAIQTRAGTDSAPAGVSVVIDTTAPETTILSGPASPSNSRDATFTVTGSDDGSGVASFQCSLDGAAFSSCPLVGTGIVGLTGLSDGPHMLQVRAVDGLGNSDASPATFQWTVDTVVPGQPTLDAPGPNSTISALPATLSGNAETGATVNVQLDGVTVCTVVAQAGRWSCPVTQSLADGAHAVTVMAVDPAGNASPTLTVVFTLDAARPAAPTIRTPSEGETVGGSRPVIAGSAEANSTVTVSIDGTPATVTADGQGAWSFSPTSPLADGTHSVTATARDAAGNSSDPSGARSFTVDTTQPTEPLVTRPPSGGHVVDGSPTFRGTAEPGSTVAVLVDGDVVGTTTAAADGSWSLVPTTPIAAGSHNVRARATDGVGNTTTGRANTFTVDAPGSATLTVLSPVEGAVLSDASPTVSGHSGPGYAVEISVDGVAIATVTADDQGNWSFTPSGDLSQGTHTVAARATDAGGKDAGAASVGFSVDSIAPASPTLVLPASPAFVSERRPVFSGTAEPGSTVRVSANGTVVATGVADGLGAWSATPTADLAEGRYDVVAVAVDGAGNTSGESNHLDLTVDVTAPQPPTILSPTDGARTNGTPTVGGTSEPGATVVVTVDGTTVCTVVADAAGRFECTVSPALSDGSHAIAATARDLAGNTGTASAEIRFSSDSSAPAQPVISAPASGAAVANLRPEVSGTAPAGSTVTVRVDGTSVGTATAAADGSWSLTLSADLTEGSHTVDATATNGAGSSAPSVPVQFTVDVTAPVAPTLTSPTQGQAVPGGRPTFTGTGEPNATVVLVIDGTTITLTADAQGRFTYTPADPLPTGSHTVSVTQKDRAGNASTATQVTFSTVPVVTSTSSSSSSSASSSSGSSSASSSGSGSSGSSSASSSSSSGSSAASSSSGSSGRSSSSGSSSAASSSGSSGRSSSSSGSSSGSSSSASGSGSSGRSSSSSSSSASSSGSSGSGSGSASSSGSSGSGSGSGSTGDSGGTLGSSMGGTNSAASTGGFAGEIAGGGCQSAAGGWMPMVLMAVFGLRRRRS